MTLTQEQVDVLLHATGGGSGTEQRNHYVTSPDDAVLGSLVDLGLMNRSKPVAWMGGDCVYRVTEAGLAEVKERRPARRRKTAGARNRTCANYHTPVGGWGWARLRLTGGSPERGYPPGHPALPPEPQSEQQERAVNPEDMAALVELAERLRTQDGRSTSEPVYLVQEKEIVTGFDPDYTGDIRWIDADGEFASEEEHAKLEARYEEFYDEPDGWTRTGVAERWVTVQWFLTDASAHEYIARNSHRHRDGLRVYVDSAYRNFELQLLRRVLPLLVGMLQMLEDTGASEHNVLALVELYNKAEAAMFAQNQRIAELEAKVSELEKAIEMEYPP